MRLRLPTPRPLRRAIARLAARRGRLSPFLALGFSLAATAAVTAYVSSSARSRDRLRFESQVQQTATALDRRIETYVDILVGTVGLFAASDHVSAQEFTDFVGSLRVQDRYPGIQGVGFSVRLPVAARDSLRVAQRAAGFEGFRAWPEPRGTELHAIVYLVPRDARNREALGFDMASEPVRREAMERARDSGRPAASGPVRLVQEIDSDVQPGFLIYVPVYRGSGVPETVAERRERLHGFVYSPFRARDLLLATLGPEPPVELRIHDGSAAYPGSLLFDSRGGARTAGDSPRLQASLPIDVAGRDWIALASSGSAFETAADPRLAPATLLLGLLVSGILFVLTAAEARAHARAERTARALRASEAQYRTAFEANPNPMWIYDTETLGFLAANDTAVRHYGYSREEFRGMTLRDIRPREDLPALYAELQRLPDGPRGPGVWRHRKRDGTVILVEISANPISFDGRPCRLVLAHDVTEREGSRAELEEAQRRIQRILSLSAAVVYTMEVRDEGLVPTWVADNLPRVTGYSVEEGLAPGWWDAHLHPDDQGAVASTADSLLEAGHCTLEYRFRHAEGHYIWIRDDAVLQRGEPGSPDEVIGSWVDVTERRHLQEQFEQAQKMEAVGRLAGGIAHDFNNILTVIRSQSDLLLLDLPEGPLAGDVVLIQQAADRAARLTGQLLAFSRDQLLRPRIVDATQTIRELQELLERVLGETVSLVLDLPEGLPAVEVDPGPLEQALINLAVNARDAMPDGGTLTFSAREDRLDAAEAERLGGVAPGVYTVLRVSDTGTGMDAGTQARIFEPFFTTKPRGKGTGLGMAMVYGFMRQSRGGVRVSSEPGRGAAFDLYFPASEATAVSEAATPAADASGQLPAGTVLLIEDDPSVRRATRKILERVGLSVVDFETAEAGIQALEDGRGFALAITDLVLPGRSGRDFVEHARKRTPELPLIVMSGYEEDSAVPPAELPAEVAFVRKPFTAEALVAAVRAALGA